MQLSYGYRELDVSLLDNGAMLSHPIYGNISDTWKLPGGGPVYEKSYVDLSAGFLVNYREKLFAGVSIFHLNQPDVGLFEARGLPQHVKLHASYNMEYTKNLRLQFFCLMNVQQDFYSARLAVNALVFDHLISGVAYSDFNTAVLSAGYRNSFFTILMGYDVTISKLAGYTAAS